MRSSLDSTVMLAAKAATSSSLLVQRHCYSRQAGELLAASKRGLIALVQAAALEYGPHNIRINAMLPGTTDTDLVRRVAGMEQVPDAVWKAAAAEWAQSHLPGLARMANPEEIAEFAHSRTSADEYPFMTGAALVIDGGKTAQGGDEPSSLPIDSSVAARSVGVWHHASIHRPA